MGGCNVVLRLRNYGYGAARAIGRFSKISS